MLSLCYLNPAEGRTYGFPGIPSFGISVLLTVADSTKYLRYFYPHPYYIFNNFRYGMKMNLIRPVHRFKLRQPPPLSLARLFRSSPSSMIRSFRKKEKDIRRVLYSSVMASENRCAYSARSSLQIKIRVHTGFRDQTKLNGTSMAEGAANDISRVEVSVTEVAGVVATSLGSKLQVRRINGDSGSAQTYNCGTRQLRSSLGYRVSSCRKSTHHSTRRNFGNPFSPHVSPSWSPSR